MKIAVQSGAALAIAAAALVMVGTSAVTPSYAAAKVGHCVGANACKGTSACKTASNACKGQNACKGKGFTEATKSNCAKVAGAKFELPKKS